MNITTIRIAATLISMLLFIGIVLWAVAAQNRTKFEEASKLPLLEE
jgi:cytochrome c oxidase cbb3-type subunit IV